LKKNYHILEDNELLNNLQSGDERAFTEIYNRYWEKLLAIGFYHTHNKHVAEDIVHEVFISLWARKADLHIRSLQSYLATAVKFSVFKAIARDRRQRDILSGQPADTTYPDLENHLDAKMLMELLQGVVESLPEKARLVFHYSREDDLSTLEISKKMDLSPKAVEYHLTKALRALRNTFQKIKLFFL
jgi:RNA polymerase sigma-70 factor (ECF subfamily)